MRKVKIATLVMLCILTAGLCGIFAYGISGHDIYVRGYDAKAYESYGNPQLLMEKEIPLDGIDNISVQYDMNSNDIYIYESEGDFLSIKEYNELDLKEEELSTVTVTGSSIEVRGKSRNGKRYQVQIGLFGIRSAYGYTEIGLPSSYKGQLTFSTASGDMKSRMDIAIEKEFKAAASSGDVIIPGITAKNVSLSCTSGDIEVESIHTDVSGVTGTINIATSSGNIDVSQLTGTMDIGSASGEITVKQLEGETKIKSSSGNIASEIISGNARLETTSGDISVQHIEGDVTAEASSGSVEIHEGGGERIVRTTSGDIQTFFDEDLSFSKKGNSANGTHGENKSGNSIVIRTTSGDVQITD